VLILNPKAAGTGLNITAANHVIHFNLEWNPAVEDQASARAHRRGQMQIVTVHRFFYIDTVEDVINDRMARKRQLASAAIVGTDGADADMQDILRALRVSPVNRDLRSQS
jgi:SNF2 family DNA or RNA helicase